MNLFVIIPAYNESKIIAETIRSVKSLYPNVVAVDDGSADNTFEEAEKAGAVALRHIINRGQGAALRTGINYAILKGAEIIVTFDADGQFEPSEIEKMIKPIRDGECDITLGSRFLGKNKVPFLKNWILKLAIFFTRAITGLKLTDVHNGFRAISAKAGMKIKIRQDRMAHASDIIHEIARLGLKFKEVPVTVKYTDYSIRKGQKISGALKIIFDLMFK
ncbi:MAG: glycosyltransferase family 2 protein [Patescibacteria group bacterium]